jgi:hypothetical protein
MKLTTSILIFALAASASAQQKPADQPVPVKPGTIQLKTPAKPAAATKPAASTAKPVSPAPAAKNLPAAAKTAPAPVPAKSTAAPAVKKDPMVAAKPATVVPVKKAAAPKPVTKHVTKSHKAVPQVAEKPKAPEAENTAQLEKAAPVSRAKRDPFQTVIVDRSVGGVCSGGGKQCLVPDEVALRGIVRSNGSIIAVVTTKENRAYFLRENDPVLNGVVIRITEGSITFRERTTDIFGKQVMREVVKKITPTAA